MTWTDDDGVPLGSWLEVDPQEWRSVMERAGGYGALTVFSTLTDPEGVYGEPQVYTAWGRSGDAAPLVDIRDYMAEDGTLARRVCRRFVGRAREPASARRSNAGT